MSWPWIFRLVYLLFRYGPKIYRVFKDINGLAKELESSGQLTRAESSLARSASRGALRLEHPERLKTLVKIRQDLKQIKLLNV